MKTAEIIIAVVIMLLATVIIIWILVPNFNSIYKSFSNEKESKTPEDVAKAFVETMDRIDQLEKNKEEECLIEIFPSFPFLFGNSNLEVADVSGNSFSTVRFSIEGRFIQDEEKANLEIKFLFVNPSSQVLPPGCREAIDYLNVNTDEKDPIVINFKENIPTVSNVAWGDSEIQGIFRKCPIYLASGYAFKQKKDYNSFTTLSFLVYPKSPTIITDISVLKNTLLSKHGINWNLCK